MKDLHDQLVHAYLEYFRANEIWERKHSVRTYSIVQKATREIKRLAKERNTEIKEIQRQKSKNQKGENN